MKETNVLTSFPAYKTQTHQKTPKSLCHQPKHSHCQEEKPKAFRGFYRAVRQRQGLVSASMQGLTEQPQTTTVPTHIPCSHSPALGIAAVSPVTPASPVQM